jgi:hypothetical protein
LAHATSGMTPQASTPGCDTDVPSLPHHVLLAAPVTLQSQWHQAHATACVLRVGLAAELGRTDGGRPDVVARLQGVAAAGHRHLHSLQQAILEVQALAIRPQAVRCGSSGRVPTAAAPCPTTNRVLTARTIVATGQLEHNVTRRRRQGAAVCVAGTAAAHSLTL